MRDLPSTTGPVSYGETSWETGDAPEAFTGQATIFQELIAKANSVPLMTIFRHYNIRIDAVRCQIVCPFKSHKGGRERTGSFKYFSETNSFHCYGCKVGSQVAHAVEFVAHMDGISRLAAAKKIIKLFGSEIDSDALDEMVDERAEYSEKIKVMFEFSNVVREFRLSFPDENANLFIEKICRVYDDLNTKHTLDLKAMRRCVEELKEEINNYKPCLML